MSRRDEIYRQAVAYLGAALFLMIAPPAQAQTCPPGYYYASDGNCYPGSPPSYPPPTYDVAPPVAAPPVVVDGLLIGLGMVLGGVLTDDHHGRVEEHRPPPRRDRRDERRR